MRAIMPISICLETRSAFPNSLSIGLFTFFERAF
jgi:hypothetical protein